MKERIAALTWLLCFCVMAYAQNPVQKVSYPFPVKKGIQLESDIYFTDTSARYPVVLLRTPYPRRQYESIANYFVAQRYIVVVQSVRGTGGSTGRMMPFVNETDDGLAMLDLVTDKSWCNGSIGMFGSSYGAFCGLTLGASGHPSLKAIVNINGWLEPSLIAMPSGVNHLMMNIPWMLFNFSNGKLLPNKQYNADSLFKTVPVNDMMKGLGTNITLDQMQSGIAGLNKDVSYDAFNVPVLHITGMYDFTKEGTFTLYDSLRKHNKTQRIIIGPWVHDQIFSGARKVGDRELPPPGYDSLDKRILRQASAWMRLYVKKDSTAYNRGLLTGLPVFGESFNLNATGFPEEEIAARTFYLTKDKDNTGKLVRKPVTETSVNTFTSDPNNPVPTNGGANFHFFTGNIGLKLQNEIEKRPDVLVYTSDKINSQFWGLGKAKVKTYVSFSGKDCDFTAKLVAVDLDGKAWNISDGITRMSLAKKKDTGTKDAEGNAIYEIEIDLGHITFILKPRWSFRLEIAGSNFPKYDRNPGNGDHPLTALSFQPVKQFVHHGKAFPSVLLIDELD